MHCVSGLYLCDSGSQSGVWGPPGVLEVVPSVDVELLLTNNKTIKGEFVITVCNACDLNTLSDVDEIR